MAAMLHVHGRNDRFQILRERKAVVVQNFAIIQVHIVMEYLQRYYM